MLRQTSSEAEGIFDLILALHEACDGKWNISSIEMLGRKILMHGLSMRGCFYRVWGDGDRKVIPNVSHEVLRKMASVSPDASAKFEEIITPMMEIQPAALGYPDGANQSGYYIGDEKIKKKDIEAITKMMEARGISPENTRLRKLTTSNRLADENSDVFEILQASAERDAEPLFLGELTMGEKRRARIYLRRGDHSEEMSKICAELTLACKVAATDEQKTALSQLVDSFLTGDYDIFRSAQKTWVTDKNPRVEYCMGFLFGYRDAHGVRAEWQAVAGIYHSGETEKMRRLFDKSAEFIRPFEPSELYVPDFAVIHVLASVSSTVWDATNITIDDDGKRHGVKNMVYGNRMNLNSSPNRPCYYIHPSEVETYMTYAHRVRFVTTAIYELIGHGTGKLLSETVTGKFKFGHANPLISPVTAATVEECRAFLIADYLADSKDILALFGYDQESTPTADEFNYYTYLQIGIEGLRALRSFKVDEQTWGSDHDQAQFTILKHLHQNTHNLFQITHDAQNGTLHIRLDRSKILSYGKPSLGRTLCKLHIWRSTANIETCRFFYGGLSAVDGEYKVRRKIVAGNIEPKWKFVQGSTFLGEDGGVEVREYEGSNIGIVRSFWERERGV
ncbi:hypothetical protein sscle_09g073690 [Sclerotinia sclerotiorum 1980 UF-70]|uniref:Dipeptidyl peptidase III n=1 Tax=Sclerotinia sclerotiorum (strain ATCC 18683 / 1980 / Ss-1) TaxID=665079 RepID=A0A1D9QCJ2_SCLS1|nr:hypothetical protein sscle_09g073690 [Sclerotinia sclerotiorum 1980 UF-70]